MCHPRWQKFTLTPETCTPWCTITYWAKVRKHLSPGIGIFRPRYIIYRFKKLSSNASGLSDSARSLRDEARLETTAIGSSHASAGETAAVLSSALLIHMAERRPAGLKPRADSMPLLEQRRCSPNFSSDTRRSASPASPATSPFSTSNAPGRIPGPETSLPARMRRNVRDGSDASRSPHAYPPALREEGQDMPTTPRSPSVSPANTRPQTPTPTRKRKRGQTALTDGFDVPTILQGHGSKVLSAHGYPCLQVNLTSRRCSAWHGTPSTTRFLPQGQCTTVRSVRRPSTHTLTSRSKDGSVTMYRLDPDGPQTRSQRTVLTDRPQADVTSLVWDAEGGLLAIASRDCNVRVLTTDGAIHFDCFFTQVSHAEMHSGYPSVRDSDSRQGSVSSVSFSPLRGWLVAGSSNGEVSVWDVPKKRHHRLTRFSGTDPFPARMHPLKGSSTTYSERRSLPGHRLAVRVPVHCVRSRPPRAHDERELRACHRLPVRTLLPYDSGASLDPDPRRSGHKKKVNRVAINAGRTMIASCSDDHTARVWHWTTSMLREDASGSVPPVRDCVVLQGHSDAVTAVRWSGPDRDIVATFVTPHTGVEQPVGGN